MRSIPRRSLILPLLAAFLVCVCDFAGAQGRSWGELRRPSRFYERQRGGEDDTFPGNTFTFCRVLYRSYWGGGGGGGCWTDYPESDRNFSIRLAELTTIEVNRYDDGRVKYVQHELTDPEIVNYPYLYMLEVAGLEFTEEEVEGLRKHLLRGGFLHVDDFWGSRAWDNWLFQIRRVFPDEIAYPIIDVPMDHDIFKIVFKVRKVPQIPSIHFWRGSGGETSERYGDSAIPRCYGLFDAQNNNRLMAVFTHNTDLGDGWEEEAVDPEYFRTFSASMAYPLGINIVVYAMTH